MILLELRHILEFVKYQIGFTEVVWPHILLMQNYSIDKVVLPEIGDMIGREV